MAVVVWLFAGGGEAEVRGLIPFLRQHFPGCTFERKTPVRQKPGPKPNKNLAYGKTGQSLIDQIKKELPIALRGGHCDLILVIDDLDCRNPDEQKQKFLAAIDTVSAAANIDRFVGFAAPELEAWIIADWEKMAKITNFRGNRWQQMRWWLSSQRNVDFEHPESFSEYDAKKDSCREKLSDAIVEASEMLDESNRNKPRFSKSTHSPLLLLEIDPSIVQKKCPLFRDLYTKLNNFCQQVHQRPPSA
ncbi:MAG TPA: DUF4276 family protein [Oscillatoriaceae cyanobacterium M33_DOE_052]|uniref:DUF4276 family protein n=1 Tax=Planktothricoides sp. SpSt-374 TaxID=2282167 RepID=A0A7C3VF04_9CYAN|nr:DUF4276 family protein [Oscillatoriaceae cyanobacterium M33_DOE_052]